MAASATVDTAPTTHTTHTTAGGSTISVTRALTMLKNLSSRTQEQIRSGTFVSVHGESRPPTGPVLRSAETFQSILDRDRLQRNLRSAIIQSNAATKITLCGRSVTVAEAIEEKKSIETKRLLSNTLKAQLGEATYKAEQHNQQLRDKLERDAARIFPTVTASGEASTAATLDLEGLQKSYLKLNALEVYDPLDLAAKIKELNEYIEKFDDEVDMLLSEKNATTMITVPGL